MRVATWNLQSDRSLTRERAEQFRQAMEEVDADVWVVTESWTDTCLLPTFQLASQSSDADDLESNRRWVAIWSKCDVERVEVVHQPDRMTCARIKLSGADDVLIVGTVLPWKFDRAWPNSDGFRAALDIQQTEWRWLATSAPDHRLLLAGDFNQSLPHCRYYGSRANELALTAALDSLQLRCVTSGNDALTEQPRIDHICAHQQLLDSSDSLPVGTWLVPKIGGKAITDHAGVYVDLKSV